MELSLNGVSRISLREKAKEGPFQKEAEQRQSPEREYSPRERQETRPEREEGAGHGGPGLP